MGVAEYAIINLTGRVNTPLDFWGCTNSPICHADMFQTYGDCPNKMDLEFSMSGKAVNSIVQSIHFRDGRYQGLSG